MRFTALPVHDLEDATLNFDQLQKLDILNLTAESVLQLASTGTARRMSFGVQSLTWTASSLSAVATVTHNLGTTPLIVVATSNQTTTFFAYVGCDTFTSTTFKMQGAAGASVTITSPVCWLAIG